MISTGQTIPDFKISSTTGEISLYKYLAKSWCIICTTLGAFSPVCTTELAELQKNSPEFESRNVKVLVLTSDTVDNCTVWLDDIEAHKPGCRPTFPILCDIELKVCQRLDLLSVEAPLDRRGMPLPSRSIMVISPGKKIQFTMTHPYAVGRNFEEILRCIDSMQITENTLLATPVNWTKGMPCLALPMMTNNYAQDKLKKSLGPVILPSGKKYMNYIDI